MPFGPRFDQALVLASDLHRDQVRKSSGVPYVSHLMAVAALVAEFGGDEDETIAAMLHDAIEDQGGLPTLERIRSEFGDRVAAIVAGCTDSFSADSGNKAAWRERKEKYLAHLETTSASVRLVSCADKLHNAQAIVRDLRHRGAATWTMFKGGRDGTLWYYASLVAAYQQFGAPPVLLADLVRYVQVMHELAGQPFPVDTDSPTLQAG